MSPDDGSTDSGGGAPPGFSVPPQGDVFSTGPGDTNPTVVAPGNPTPDGGTAPGGGFQGGSPGGAAGGSPGTGYGAPGALTPDQAVFTISPPGMQAPLDQHNFSAGSPFDPMSVFPPGQAAPIDHFQMNSQDGTGPSPAAFALSMFALPGSASGWNALDDQTKATFEGEARKDNYPGGGQALWEKESAANAGSGKPQGTAFIPGQQYVDKDAQGNYDVFVGGQKKGVYGTEAGAERAYNQDVGLPNAAAPVVPPKPPVDPQVNALNQRINALEQATVQSNQQAARDNLFPNLASLLESRFGPGVLNTANALLNQMGLPSITQTAAISPNTLSPAQWDALPDSVRTLILQSMGGDQSPTAIDFVKGIDAQRPVGSVPTGVNVQFAPLAR